MLYPVVSMSHQTHTPNSSQLVFLNMETLIMIALSSKKNTLFEGKSDSEDRRRTKGLPSWPNTFAALIAEVFTNNTDLSLAVKPTVSIASLVKQTNEFLPCYRLPHSSLTL